MCQLVRAVQPPTVCSSHSLGGQVAAAIQQLCTRLQQEKGRQLTDKEQLVLRLNKQYPDDVGILAVYFLNYIRLKADQVQHWPS